MDKMEAFRRAVAEWGEVTPEHLASLIERRYGVRIEPRYIPLFRATAKDLDELTRLREAARAAATPPTSGTPQATAAQEGMGQV
jgi:hypothetical protein